MAGDAETDRPSKLKAFLPGFLGLLLFFFLGAGVEWFLLQHQNDQNAEAKAATQRYAETLRARLEGELNGVVVLSNGIAGVWAALPDGSDNEKAMSILATVFRQSRHVRSFAVAVGYRVAYAYPPDDSSLLVNLDDKTKTALWPSIQHGIETHSGFMAWPDPPDHGLAYRVPIFKNGIFWGLLTTLIDDASLFAAAGLTDTTGEYAYAVRNQPSKANNALDILGPAELFDDPASCLADIAIPEGQWKLAVKPVKASSVEIWTLLVRVMGWLVAAHCAGLAVIAWTLNRKLAALALYDRLTGLPGRPLFLDRLKQAMRRTKRNKGNFTIVSVNLDRAPSINASHGVKIGDMISAEIGKRLIGFVRNCDTVTRWEDDQFLILLDGCPQDQADRIAENLRHQIELPIFCGELQLRIGAALGLATFPDDGLSLSALLKVAGARMTQEKNQMK